MGCPGRWWSHRPWGCSRKGWTWCLGTWFSVCSFPILTWYLLDAKMQPPGKIAAATVIRLEGRHKPIYHALSEYCSTQNTKHVCFFCISSYPGGFKQVTATQLHLKDPTAVSGLLKPLLLVIPEDIEKNLLQEIPQPRAVPRRLDEYTPEEIAAFPRVWTPQPENNENNAL
uniref:Mitochondrial ribosomal protein L13 n=1 Tax=Cairina moschata TaxID=8855 RepID=A0A8C3C6E2_CAIMO